MKFEKNVHYLPYKPMSVWRKIALGTWSHPGDPSVYGSVDLDARGILKYIEIQNEKSIKISPTAVMAKAIATALKETPALNGIIRFGRIYRRKDVDIFLQVAEDLDGENLSGMVVRNCDQKTLGQIQEEIRLKAEQIKSGNDEGFKKIKKDMGGIPGFCMGHILKFVEIVLYLFNIWTPALGPKDGFGSAMVTSVGMLGLEHGFAPLVPYSRCPLVVAIGKITERVIAENGQIIIRPHIPMSVTFDHRFIDGVGAAKMLKSIKNYLSNPY